MLSKSRNSAKRRWKINILIDYKGCKISRVKLKSLTGKILSLLDCSHLPASVNELNIIITSNQKIRFLNRDYRGKNRATDVLSFSQIEGDNFGAFSETLGDVVISYPKVRVQAREYKVTIFQELTRLFIHGILHLFGFDHENVSKKKRLEMENKEDYIFERVNEVLD